MFLFIFEDGEFRILFEIFNFAASCEGDENFIDFSLIFAKSYLNFFVYDFRFEDLNELNLESSILISISFSFASD
jgi:hypothetical protein